MAKKNFKFNYFLLLCIFPIVVAIAIAFPQSVTTHEYNSSGGVKATSPLEFHFNPNYSGSSFTQEEWKVLSQEGMTWWQWIETADLDGVYVADDAPRCPDFGNNQWDWSVCDDLGGAAGWAVFTWNGQGQMVECDIEMHENRANNWSQERVRSISAHEFGHCAGFAHPFDGFGPPEGLEDFQSVMNYSTPPDPPGLNNFGSGVHYDPRGHHDATDASGKYPCGNPEGCLPVDDPDDPDDPGGGGDTSGSEAIIVSDKIVGEGPESTFNFDGGSSTPSELGTYIAVYEWNWGDGTTDLIPCLDGLCATVIAHTYNLNCTELQQDEKGNCYYDVTLTVGDDLVPPSLDTDTVTIKVKNPFANEDPVPLINITCIDNCKTDKNGNILNEPNELNFFKSIDDGVTFNFDGSGSLDPDGIVVDWTWNFSDGSPLVNDSVVDHEYTQGGSFPILLTVVDNEGDDGIMPTPPFVLVPSYPLPVLLDFPSDQACDAPYRSRFVSSDDSWEIDNEDADCSVSDSDASTRWVRFDGSESVDTDGSIRSFIWNFSDPDDSEGFLAVWTKQFNYTRPCSLDSSCDTEIALTTWDGHSGPGGVGDLIISDPPCKNEDSDDDPENFQDSNGDLCDDDWTMVDYDRLFNAGVDIPGQITFRSSLNVRDNNSNKSDVDLENNLHTFVVVHEQDDALSSFVNSINSTDGSSCAGTKKIFSISSDKPGSGMAGFNYEWDFGDGDSVVGFTNITLEQNIEILSGDLFWRNSIGQEGVVDSNPIGNEVIDSDHNSSNGGFDPGLTGQTVTFFTDNGVSTCQVVSQAGFSFTCDSIPVDVVEGTVYRLPAAGVSHCYTSPGVYAVAFDFIQDGNVVESDGLQVAIDPFIIKQNELQTVQAVPGTNNYTIVHFQIKEDVLLSDSLSFEIRDLWAGLNDLQKVDAVRIYKSNQAGDLLSLEQEVVDPFVESTSFTISLDGPLSADDYYVVTYVFGS